MPSLETLPLGDPSGGVFYLRIVLSPEEAFRLWVFRTHFFFHGKELLAPRPTPKLEDHPLPAVRDCLFNLFAATLHIGGRSSIRNLRTRHAVVTGTNYCLYLLPEPSQLVTMSARAHHVTLSRARLIPSRSFHPISWRSIWILCSIYLSVLKVVSFPRLLPPKPWHAFILDGTHFC